jgi:hypothetical protein
MILGSRERPVHRTNLTAIFEAIVLIVWDP